jgi:acyl-CoA reductase-like NAD-dependent aldehyde dehydrogenase
MPAAAAPAFDKSEDQVTTPVYEPLDIHALVPNGCQLINGQWVPSRNGLTIDVLDPSTQQVWSTVPRGDASDIDDACQAAQAAFPAWRDMNPTLRANLMRRWAQLCDERGEELGRLEAMEVGRPHRGASSVGDMIRYFAGSADKIHGTTLPATRPDVLGMTLREPFGVCGSIVPWNGPSALMMGDVAPALAAGNTMVAKPAEDAPLTCLFLAKLALEAGIPAGVFNIVTGYGNEAGAALPVHPLIRHISFTGSPETGARVMELCARNLVPLHLELGGKSPQIVLRDADLDEAVPTIVRRLVHNAGQTCFTGTRLLVEKELHSSVVQAISEEMRRVRIGAWNEDVDMGPLINVKQEQRVLGYMDIGREEGARVVTGGRKPEGDRFHRGFFVEPTLFDAVTPDMRIAQEEIFGPVLSVLTFTDPEEAIEIANGTKYGLAAAIWTGDVKRAVRFIRGIEAGQVYVNTYGFQSVIGAPFGGYKHSGFGRTVSHEAILEYTQVKSVIINGAE